jgi:Mrp family chromosome partitioning ATPase
MNIWEEVYSKHKQSGGTPAFPPLEQNQHQSQQGPSEATKHESKPAGSGSMEDVYYKGSKSLPPAGSGSPEDACYKESKPQQPVKRQAQNQEPKLQPQAPIKPLKSRFIPRIQGKLTTPYPALLSKVHYGLSDTWANIMLETKQSVRTLLVCGPVGKEGVTLISFHLAMLLSKEYSMKVLYVDTNLKHTAAIPKIQSLPGVYSFVAEQKDLAPLIVQTEYPGLYLLPSGAGAISKNIGGNMLSREAIEGLLQFCRTNFDVTIIDGQPVVSSPVMIEFARVVDLTLLVCRFGYSRHEVCKLAIDKLQKFGITSLGVLLNDRKFIVPQKLYKLLG